jgi:hypothetical protein
MGTVGAEVRVMPNPTSACALVPKVAGHLLLDSPPLISGYSWTSICISCLSQSCVVLQSFSIYYKHQIVIDMFAHTHKPTSGATSQI